MTKPHKFFETFLDNDVNDLKKYLADIETQILDDNILRIPQDKLIAFGKNMGSATKIGIDYYNIFTFNHPSIHSLYVALRDLMKDVCDYYNIDFIGKKYVIHGWFNLDYATPNEGKFGGVNPVKNEQHFHDHMNGMGVPTFHGYYCVDAEPSYTFYKIKGNENIFANINKNNRAIISETGHPHGRDDWYEKDPRITIAYDIVPSDMVSGQLGKWIPLS